ncbi:MAG: DoxX family protein [Nitrososphaerales archaeon]
MLKELTLYSDVVLLLMRLLLGGLMMVHGRQLLFSKADRAILIPMMAGLGVPRVAFELSAILTFFGGLFAILGLLTRLIAIFFIIFMLSTIILYITKLASTLPMGAFDKDFKKSRGYIKGWELDTMIITTSLTLLIWGAGAYSLDNLLNIL